ELVDVVGLRLERGLAILEQPQRQALLLHDAVQDHVEVDVVEPAQCDRRSHVRSLIAKGVAPASRYMPEACQHARGREAVCRPPSTSPQSPALIASDRDYRSSWRTWPLAA